MENQKKKNKNKFEVKQERKKKICSGQELFPFCILMENVPRKSTQIHFFYLESMNLLVKKYLLT